MATISANQVKELRELTSASVMDCKRALEEGGGDLQKAAQILKRKGHAAAAKRSSKEIKEGRVQTYVHHNGKVATMVELGCETDFVANNVDFQKLLKDLCLHVAAMRPTVVSREQVSADEVAEEKARLLKQVDPSKPDAIKEKIVEGRMGQFYASQVLLDQPTVDDPNKSVGDRVRDLAAKVGENIQVVRFSRFEVGKQD